MDGLIYAYEKCGVVDGPGIRLVVFFYGCPMRCLYCHNPESYHGDKYQVVIVNDIINEYLKYQNYYSGVTISGGEPLLQIDFLIELLKEFKKLNVHTAVDTSGVMFNNQIEYLELIKYVDLFLLDLKIIDELKHINLTSCSNKPILAFFKFLDEQQKEVIVRYVLVDGLTSEIADLKKARRFLNQFKNIKDIEVIPYHKHGIYKYQELNLPYKIENIEVMDQEKYQKLKNILCGGK